GLPDVAGDEADVVRREARRVERVRGLARAFLIRKSRDERPFLSRRDHERSRRRTRAYARPATFPAASATARASAVSSASGAEQTVPTQTYAATRSLGGQARRCGRHPALARAARSRAPDGPRTAPRARGRSRSRRRRDRRP